MKTPHSVETSAFWESKEDESYPEEKYNQTVSRNSSPLGSSFTYCSAEVRVASQSGMELSPREIVCGRPFQAVIGVEDMYIDQEVGGKSWLVWLSELSAGV